MHLSNQKTYWGTTLRWQLSIKSWHHDPAQELQMNSNCKGTLVEQSCIFLSSSGPHPYTNYMEFQCVRIFKVLKYSSYLIFLQKGCICTTIHSIFTCRSETASSHHFAVGLFTCPKYLAVWGQRLWAISSKEK